MHYASRASQRGNVLFLILIAVGLFAALSYAVTSSSRSGSGDTSGEKAKLTQAVMDSYMAAINAGTMRLQFRGCTTIDYTPPSGWGSESHKCHLFHPEGGQVAYQDLGLDDCQMSGGTPLAQLALGQSCGSMVYAGVSGGKRIYTTTYDSSASIKFCATGTYQQIASGSSGSQNTDLLIASGNYAVAAGVCRALGPTWFLPSNAELGQIYTNRNAGVLAGTFTSVTYWSSNQHSNGDVFVRNFGTGGVPTAFCGNPLRLRCARYD